MCYAGQMRAVSTLAALVLALMAVGACSSTTETWQDERIVEESPEAPAKCEVLSTGGTLRVTLSQRIEETTRPVTRLVLVHEDVVSTIDWDEVGMIFFYVLCGVAVVVGYVLVYFAISALEEPEPGSDP